MKKLLQYLTLIVFLLSLAGCNSLHNPSPRVDASVTISKLTQEEFARVGVYGLKNPSIDDFRKLDVKVKLINTKGVSNKILEVPTNLEYKEALDKDIKRYWFGKSSYQNNPGEDFPLAEDSLVFYSRGLSQENIKDMLAPLKVTVGWVTKNGVKDEKKYTVVELLKF